MKSTNPNKPACNNIDTKSEPAKRFYHYTCLLWLPSIMREGIKNGEIPVDPAIPYQQSKLATNLSTNGNREDQLRIWAVGCFDKTRIRLTVDVQERELINYRQLRERFSIRAKWAKLLAPIQERKHWFYAFGGVPTEKISGVELWNEGRYAPIAGADLDKLIAAIEAERNRALHIEVAKSGRFSGYRTVQLHNGISSSWLLDGSSW
ncbi:hypothetical protein LBMAG52_11230 [Planctomycetia bacterium]|nr:hypothetical protein LBMAG52_11230 [Planctomycetia bacterium]